MTSFPRCASLSRAAIALVVALPALAVLPPVNAAGAIAPGPAGRVVLGQARDAPLAASTDADVRRTLGDLRAVVAARGRVRLIAGVRVPFAPEGTLAATDAQAQRNDIAQAQQRVEARLPGQAAATVTRFTVVPFIALEADGAALAALTEMPEITDLQEDVPEAFLLPESVPLIRADAAWAAGHSGTGWAVAVLDTGVDRSHPFLAGKVVSEACYSTASNTYFTTSVCPGGFPVSTAPGSAGPCPASVPGCEHGTHVAGTAAGLGTAFSGVAKGASIISITTASILESASSCKDGAPCLTSYPSDQVAALERVYALRGDFNIAAVNMSLGSGRYYSRSTCDAANLSRKAIIDTLRAAGIVTIVASGNNGYVDSLNAPACISSAVATGATLDAAGIDNSGLGWSGGPSGADVVGHFTNIAPFLDLLAPGRLIKSSIPGGGFREMWGTSLAAPHVAGCWAILKSARPAATPDQVLQAMKYAGTLVHDWRVDIARPRIDCKATLDYLVAADPNLSANPGFESGPVGWVQTATGTGIIITESADFIPHAGSWYAWFGGYVSGNDTLHQDIAIPAGPGEAYVRFWYRIETKETSATEVHDTLDVAVYSTAGGARLAGLARLSNLDRTRGWVHSPPLDVSAFRGRTIRLRFSADNDAAAVTEFLVDDVTLEAPGSGSYQGMWWNAPADSEPGWGINFAHQGDVVFATWFTFGADGNPLWLVAAAGRTGPGAFAGKLYTGTGPPFDAVPFDPARVVPVETGTAAFAFTGRDDATFTWTIDGVTRTKNLTREVFASPVPACAWSAQADLAASRNYQDMWWAAPAGSESGWGINFAHQGDTVFATWFTFGFDGRPLWFVAAAAKTAANAYAGDVYTGTGPPYSAARFDAARVVAKLAGTATFTFADGNHGTFAWDVYGVARSRAITREIFGPGGGTACR